ncbi:MAG TPA: enoyl-CoA hydratase/isomerase family protein [Spirochaetales bacterium]|nr:enoyl-CoA hydratase/isomerase family protein [Spirochaetales bacterium]
MKTFATLQVQEEIGEILFTTEPAGKPPTVDFELLDQLEAHFDTLEHSRNCRALLLKSSSPKYFVVGANLEALKQINQNTILRWIERGHAVYNRLEALPFPTLAIVQGYALGGGLELAMACDLIFASSSAHFGQPEAGLGFIPGWGGCTRLPERVGWSRAKELCFTGRILDAEEAFQIGLIDFTGRTEELDAKLHTTLESIKSNSPVSITMVKKILHSRIGETRARAVLEESTASAVCISSGDTARRLEAFFKERSK